jgi:hypothetical protein
MDLNLFLLENGERGISSFTANLTQSSLPLQSVRLHWHVYYHRTFCSRAFAIQLLKKGEILEQQSRKGYEGTNLTSVTRSKKRSLP